LNLQRAEIGRSAHRFFAAFHFVLWFLTTVSEMTLFAAHLSLPTNTFDLSLFHYAAFAPTRHDGMVQITEIRRLAASRHSRPTHWYL
jgi:hypothetical protein